MECLSFQQQRFIQEQGYTSLRQLDFAALLRVLDQNWYELSRMFSLPREGRTWVKELQTVRNRWAHLSSDAMPDSERYRDADTLGRLLMMVEALDVSLEAVEGVKAAAVTSMARANDGIIQAHCLPSHALSCPSEHSETHATNVSNPPSPASLFQKGDLVTLRSNPEKVMPVIEVLPGFGECRYRVFQDSSPATYYESQLQAVSEVTDERRVLTSNEVQAYLTSIQLLSPSTTHLLSLRSGRVQFVPYQYRPVLKMIRSDRPRLLIADEVGVGKTIEAGLIMKELQARMDLSSVLIICPRALVAERKWYVEMKRFDERFTALDGKLLRHCLHETHLEGEWPEQYAKAILPFSLFDQKLLSGPQEPGRRKHQSLLSLDPPPKFDLVIVDEAHHIRNPDTYLHEGIRYFCDHAEAVVFLTATPVQLNSRDLYTLLNVLRPDLIIDSVSYDRMAEPNRYITEAVQHCRRGSDGWQDNALISLKAVAQTPWGRQFLRESAVFQGIYDRLRENSLTDIDRIQLTRSIEELYTFSSLINRTRRRDIGEFTTRKPETVTVEFTAAQKEFHDSFLDIIETALAFSHDQQNVKFMMTTVRRQAASCLYGLAPLLEDMLSGHLNGLEFMEVSDSDDEPDFSSIDQLRTDIKALLEKSHNLDPSDPKVEAFVRIITEKSKLSNNKILVFSTFRHTLAYLAEYVERTELRYGLIHGSVRDEERADLRRRFALPKEDPLAIDLLLSSEVGCEGLDFQFCDFLINYDLPWNPMRIEQRIGRIDRYGQKSETVAIVNFVTPGTIDADIYERCLWRIGVFQHSVGGNEEILGEITQEIHEIAERFTLTLEERESRLRQLADNSIRRIEEEQELETRQAELVGLNIPNHTWLQEIEEADSYWLSPEAIQRCVSCYIADILGTETEHLLGERAIKTLRLNMEARGRLLEDFKRLPRSSEPVAREWEGWLKGDQPTLSVTFDQEAAAEQTKVVYLSVVHPLVRQAAHFLQPNQVVYTALSVQNAEVPPGNYLFGLYRWKKQGVNPDELLVPVASEPAIEEVLLSILESATDIENAILPDPSEFEDLDGRHYTRWTAARSNHIAENRQQVEYRIQSLMVSHQARCKAIEDQIRGNANEKILLMKRSELARANADFNRRMKGLQQTASSGDIHATPVMFGTVLVR
jgi:superfamily II DNA or RNA helicase